MCRKNKAMRQRFVGIVTNLLNRLRLMKERLMSRAILRTFKRIESKILLKFFRGRLLNFIEVNTP